jgi:hypothetical protein
MANIRNEIIKEEPSSYQAFVYRWTNVDKNKIYIGYHTGFWGDAYKHSGQCEDFNEDFQNENYQWDYEVLDYGTTDEMKNFERDLLKAAEARNSQEYYNQTNGGSGYFHINPITTKQLSINIKDGEYLAKDDSGNPLKIKKDLFQTLLESRIQVRVQDNPEAVKHIANEIDNNPEGTLNCDAITLLENRLGNGLHQLLDGSTTMMGTLKSNHGLYLTYNLIPESVHSKFTERDLRRVGLLLNPKQKNKKWESDDKDLEEDIIMLYQTKGTPVRSKENREFLVNMECNGQKISEIFAKCEETIRQGAYTAKGTPWILYKLPQHKTKIQKRIKEIHNTIKSTKVFAFSSEKYRWEDVTKHLVDNSKSKNKIINISVIIHHPKTTSEKKWNKQLNSNQYYMDGSCNQFGVKFLGFEYMPKY